MQKRIAAVICGLSSAVFASAGCAYGREETALDRYVAAFDPIYHYELVNTVSGEGFIANVLEMTSQQWPTAAEVDRPIWKHWLTIVRPPTVTTSTGLLIISGGSNEKPPPKMKPLLTQLVLATSSIVSEVRIFPNQPLVFGGNGEKLTEDAITAFSWQKFLTSGERAIVRAVLCGRGCPWPPHLYPVLVGFRDPSKIPLIFD